MWQWLAIKVYMHKRGEMMSFIEEGDQVRKITGEIQDAFSTVAVAVFFDDMWGIRFEKAKWSTAEQRSLERLISANGRKTSGTHYFSVDRSGSSYGEPYKAQTILICVYLNTKNK